MRITDALINYMDNNKDELGHIFCGTYAFAELLKSEQYDEQDKTFCGIPCECKPERVGTVEILVVKKCAIQSLNINAIITPEGVEFS